MHMYMGAWSLKDNIHFNCWSEHALLTMGLKSDFFYINVLIIIIQYKILYVVNDMTCQIVQHKLSNILIYT